MATQIKDETERKFIVHKDLLGALAQPWIFVQAYTSPSQSVRLIPSLNLAYSRHKEPYVGITRHKVSDEIPFEEGLHQARKSLRVAYKVRYLVHSDDRAWLIDYFPESNLWIAETELKNKKEEIVIPDWADKEMTGKIKGYTYYQGQPRKPNELSILIDIARRRGSKEPYIPGHDNFNWNS